MPFIVNRENHESGIALRQEILGSDHVRKALAAEDDLIEYHHLFGHECSYAQIWSRKTLPLALRSMCVVGMLAAVSPRSGSFKAHVLGAVRNGATRKQIRQVLATISFYLGAGVGTDCIEGTREVLGAAGDVSADDRSDAGPVPIDVLRARGRSARHTILGEDFAEASNADSAALAYQRLKTEYYFGVLWSDADLDAKTRAMIVISILVAANRLLLLKSYLNAAKRLGCKKEEIDEVFLTAAIYCGAPACEDGLAAAEECFASSSR